MKKIPGHGKRSFALRPGTTGLLTGLSILQSALQVAMAIASRYVVDCAIRGNDRLLLWSLILGGVVLALVAVHTISGWLSRSTSDTCIAKMQYRLLDIVTGSPADRLQQYHSGALLTRSMDDVRTVCDGMVRVVPSLFGQIARLIGALVAVLVICPKIAPVLLIAGAVVGILTALLRGVARKLHKTVRKTEEDVSSVMQEDLRQTTLIQSLQAEDQILTRFRKKLKTSLKAKHNRRIWLVSINSAIASLSLIGTGALLIWGAVQVANDGISYGTLTAMVQLLALFRQPLVTISSLWSQLAAVDVADARLKELLSLSADPCPETLNDVTVESIVFENVTFTYPGDVQPVLSGFSATLPLNPWTCLTGCSGIGKSTLFKLILGLYTPQEGRVYLNTDHGPLDCSSATRRFFAYVPQDYALFSGTILENLQLVAPEAVEEEIASALHQAGADFVWELSDKVNTHVFENNVGLSMGQMQRLAIARSLLMKRPIFLLDECTSALDSQTESTVLKHLQNMGSQAILVTHRPEALSEERVTFVDI